MKIAIMQPTYLPWCGYFDLIDRSDVFVFLDDVQFSFGSWQQKNRIKGRRGIDGLAVPVIRPTAWREAWINTIQVDNSRAWSERHWHKIQMAYQDAPFFPLYTERLKQIYNREWALIADLNKAFVREFAKWLGLSTRFVDSHSIGGTGHKVEKVIGICKALNATEYLSPVGAFTYMTNPEIFAAHGIQVWFQHFEHPIYRQVGESFEPFLSTIDLLANEGGASLKVIRSGQRPLYTHDQMQEMLTETGKSEQRQSGLHD